MTREAGGATAFAEQSKSAKLNTQGGVWQHDAFNDERVDLACVIASQW